MTAGVSRSVGIVIYENVEVLDFAGPFEVFSVARSEPGPVAEPPYLVSLVAESADVVTAAGGMRVLPHTTFGDCPPLDVLVVPGGWGARREMSNDTLMRFLQRQAAHVSLLTSVCTGALLLARAGLLEGRRATTHWGALDLMAESFPQVSVERALHVVEDGHVLTSAGISAGIDMALRVVARQLGEAVAQTTARQMEYPYPGPDGRRVET